MRRGKPKKSPNHHLSDQASFAGERSVTRPPSDDDAGVPPSTHHNRTPHRDGTHRNGPHQHHKQDHASDAHHGATATRRHDDQKSFADDLSVMRPCPSSGATPDDRNYAVKKKAPRLFSDQSEIPEAVPPREGDNALRWKRKKLAYRRHHEPERSDEVVSPPAPTARRRMSNAPSEGTLPLIMAASSTRSDPPRPGAYREGGDPQGCDDDVTMFSTEDGVSSVQQQSVHATNDTPQLISAQLVTEPVVAAIHVPPSEAPEEEKSGIHSKRGVVFGALSVLLLLMLAAGLLIGLLVPKSTASESNSSDASTLAPTESPLKWTQLGQSIHGEAEGDESGCSISLSHDGTILAVGAPKNEGFGGQGEVGGGHVRVYEYRQDENDQAPNWKQLGDDIEGGPESSAFGGSVSLSANGDTLAIGDQFGGCCGQLHVYQLTTTNGDYDDTTWLWTEIGQVIDGDVENSGEFGKSVSLSADGRVVAAGAWYAEVAHARVYHLVGGTWTQLGQELTGEGNFGHSVSLNFDGSTLAVGESSSSFTTSGAMYIYRLIGDSWRQVGQTLKGEPVTEWGLGGSVSLSANGTIAACSTYERILVFGLQQGNDSWTQIGNDIGGNGEWWGTVVLSPDGTTVACEVRSRTRLFTHTMFRVFLLTGGAWAPLGEEFSEIHSGWDEEDRALSLSENGTILAFGTMPHIDGGGAGTVRVYSFL